MGLITQQERHEAVVDKWTAATEEVAEAMEENFDELNPIFMMANSGARGSFKQIRQLAGMRGLMANPKGEIIERPIKANFMEGLTVLEYFISTHGARKGLADTALRTADSGYLTRRLVDVAQDVIIRELDCGTDEFITLPTSATRGGEPEPEPGRPHRRAPRSKTKRGRVLVEQGSEIDRAELAELVEASGRPRRGVEPSPCARCSSASAPIGVCQACYGRSMATGKLAQIGDAVGIIAAQSIGEPGTQLTMRTFHTGGVAGADITHGLPRVVELFEARKPKGLARDRRAGRQGRRSRRPTRRSPSSSPTRPARSTGTRSRAARACSCENGREGRARARSSTRARSTRTTCSRCAGGPRPSSTSSTRCRRSTSRRASTSTTSTSS